jgi:hypothetical protein
MEDSLYEVDQKQNNDRNDDGDNEGTNPCGGAGFIFRGFFDRFSEKSEVMKIALVACDFAIELFQVFVRRCLPLNKDLKFAHSSRPFLWRVRGPFLLFVVGRACY